MSPFTTIWLVSAIITITWAQYIFVETQLTANEANDYCQTKYGTSLASIHSQQDQDYITNNCVPHNTQQQIGCIIGATDQYNERYTSGTDWQWFDGSPFNYSNWASNEPNNYNAGYEEDCVTVMMQWPGEPAGVWNDVK